MFTLTIPWVVAQYFQYFTPSLLARVNREGTAQGILPWITSLK